MDIREFGRAGSAFCLPFIARSERERSRQFPPGVDQEQFSAATQANAVAPELPAPAWIFIHFSCRSASNSRGLRGFCSEPRVPSTEHVLQCKRPSKHTRSAVSRSEEHTSELQSR